MKTDPIGRLLLPSILSLFMACLPANAQMDSLIFREETRISPERKGELRLDIDNINFVRDNEYKSKQAKGYTLPGFWLQPTLSFQPLKNLKVEAGIYMMRYWGANKYPNLNYSDIAVWKGDQTQKGFHCLPVFRVQWALSPTFNIVLGTLHGKNNHRLTEPLYNPEMGLTADPEAGVQLLWNARPLDFDLWVNWESFIFRDDLHQEAFTFGLSTRFKANRPTARTHVYFPLQAVFQHRGGEINPDAKPRDVKTWLNAAAGIGMDFHLKNRLFTKLNLETTACYFGQQAGSLLPFDKGYGIYAKAAADVWRFRIHAGYWHCKDFTTVLGNPLFGAMSTFEEGFVYDSPSMAVAKVEYSQPLGKGFAWGIHADVYSNLKADAYSPTDGWHEEGNALNFAAGLYLRIHPSFLLKRFQW